ncbi:Uncharacterized conserved protein, contains GH25 family domain [Roseateles sp. YR242]|uniref:DUF4198 domain-containing protein n=1 Tax=Roseateles sp. YR242 TaxID=1855305 RepID=UPI0008ADDC4A|nr:DUF4198 domain-containing protein [Roseateles sp. YR242]SEL28541.1 Uncharacterized conserved protein, contains GH25 family domain [Roseateles sp. YR242]
MNQTIASPAIASRLIVRLAPLALAAATLLPLSASAHMLWLLPNSANVTSRDGVVSVDAAVSEDLFNFERGLKLETLRITGPNGQSLEAENRSTARHRESFDVKLPEDGTYRISNLSQSLMGSYKQGTETKRFRSTPATLAKDVPADAEITSLTLMTNRQQTFVSKEEPGKVQFAPEGQGLELLPLGQATDLSHGDTTKFRLVLDGKPAADVAVKVLREGNRYRYKLGEVSLKTDAQGEFTVAWSEPGRYWIGANAGARGGPGAAGGTREAPLQRASVSATFEVLPK